MTKTDSLKNKTDNKNRGASDEVPKEIQEARKIEEAEIDRKVFRALKRDLIGMERENKGEIVLQKCAGKGDWFEIAEHSALLYYYYVLRVLKARVYSTSRLYGRIGQIPDSDLKKVRKGLVALYSQ